MDLKAAGIPKHTPKGKLNFHACRVAFINVILKKGEVSPKEAQELARHSTVDLTMNIYGRVREKRLSEAVGKGGRVIFKREMCTKRVRLCCWRRTRSRNSCRVRELRLL